MKLICAEYNSEGEMTPISIGDSALLRNNDDFYFPEFSDRLSCVPQIVLHAARLGKGVSSRFASRYFDAVGVSVRFYADSLAERLASSGLPANAAFSFDNSVAVSELSAIQELDFRYRMAINGQVMFEGSVSELPVSVNDFIERLSHFYLIKMGDLFLCGNTFRYSGLKMDDHIQIYLNDKCLLDFYIR